MTAPKLQKTTNYDMFVLHEHNREYTRDAKLSQSMAKYGFMPSHPLHVQKMSDGKLKIIAGHHRYDEAKRQGLPVYYIVDETPASIFELEGSSHATWRVSDFVHAYTKSGDVDYQILDMFRKKHGYTMAIAASLVGGDSAGSGNKVKDVKSGKFSVSDMKHAKDVAAITDLCRDVNIKFATSTAFVSAVSAVLRVDRLDIERLKTKIKTHSHRMTKRGTRNEYLDEIEALYNTKTTSKFSVPLAFLAKVEMKNRSAAPKKES
jgi:hypothetical protein